MPHWMIRFLLPLLLIGPATAQTINVSTIERPPFVMQSNGEYSGFSIDLWNALAQEIDVETQYILTDSFTEMLSAVSDGSADAAIANISITSAREEVIDFSQPIFDAGLQILIPAGGSSSILSAFITWEMAAWIIIGGLALFCAATIMWFFERRSQPYFEGSYREGIWPSFWWALNIVVNGGFEERVPKSWPGRIFSVGLVISSLFVVSLFVAKITTTMTVGALQSDIQSINDLYGKRVGTTSGSTSATYLNANALRFTEFDGIDALFKALEQGELDAVIHDAPVVSYYAATTGKGIVQTAGNIFQPEKYGIALQQGSTIAEEINLGLLKLREDGTYRALIKKWFGEGYQ